MKEIEYTNQFLRDLKRAHKRGKDLSKIQTVIDTLSAAKTLAAKHKPHKLMGTMKGFWECHIEPDWLLIWDDQMDTLVLVRTGTHSDLFG